MLRLMNSICLTGNAVRACQRLQCNSTLIFDLSGSKSRLFFRRTVSKSAGRFADSRPRWQPRQINRRQRIATESEIPKDSESISLAARLFASESVSTNQELVTSSINVPTNGNASQEEIDAMFKRLEDLSTVRIRRADEIKISDELESLDDTDVDSDAAGELFAEDPAHLTSVTTAGPVPRVQQLYGSPDPSVPASQVPCHGCGAPLHCHDTGIPGYIPSQRFLATPSGELKDASCQHCHLLNEFNIAIDAVIGPEQYEAITREIRKTVALVVILVDLTDLPGSFHRGIAPLVGSGRPVYIIGNKVDLLPKDEEGYLKRIKQHLVTLCEEYGMKGSHVMHVALVSAKTGYGVESLITKLLNDWHLQGQVYILGCTNAGKSTLFNALLSSDFCRNAARDVIRRATTSIWPGTTLNLLKFPIVNPKPARLYERTQWLLTEKSQRLEEENMRRKAL